MKFQSTLLQSIKLQNPLIHNITNNVVINYVANGLLALGASPIMGAAIEEVAEFAEFADAVSINIGNINPSTFQAMLISGKAANKRNIPVIFDPVGVGVSRYRRESVARILDEVKFSAIRGNASEISFLAGENWQGKGVDTTLIAEEALIEIVKTCAKNYSTIAIASGKIDYISDGQTVISIDNGSQLLPRITGSGCLLSSVVAAFFAVLKKEEFNQKHQQLLAATEALSFYAISSENAADKLPENACGSFFTAFLDALAQTTSSEIEHKAKIKIIE